MPQDWGSAQYHAAMSSSEGSLIARVRKLRGEREKLTARLDGVSAELADAVRELAEIGVPETTLAKEAGVSRQTVRTWRGKEDYKGHKIVRDS